MSESSSSDPKLRQQRSEDIARESKRLKEVIELSDSLPNALREALLRRIEEGRVEAEPPQTSLRVKQAIDSLKRAPSEVVSEVVSRVGQRVEEIKSDRVEQVKSEVKRLVDRVDLQGEIVKLLSQVSIELKTTVKLEPKEDSPLGVKPVVKTAAKLKWKDQESASDPSSSDFGEANKDET